MLNPHHLELFYYVVLHRGISRAVRRMPYGIGQPAVSGQLLQLEQQLGARLFERSPFALTPAGEALWAHVQPFFAGLVPLEERLRAGLAPRLRLGAAEPILRDHLPAVLRELRRAHPALQLHLRSGYQAQLEGWLLEGEVDLAVAAIETRPPPGLRHAVLARLPLVLLVPRRSALRSADELWRRPAIERPLIAPAPTETVSRLFQRGLARRRRRWAPAIAASSMDTVAHYVAEGYGVGLSVAGTAAQRAVRELPLHGFPEVRIAALWTGRPAGMVAEALAAVRAYAARRWPGAG